jgi:hypothetical protein
MVWYSLALAVHSHYVYADDPQQKYEGTGRHNIDHGDDFPMNFVLEVGYGDARCVAHFSNGRFLNLVARTSGNSTT